MRKLIITARKNIKELKQENTTLKRKFLPAEEKVDLTTTGSLLHKLVSEQKESETKQERVVISTRRGLSQSRSSHSSSAAPQPASSDTVGESGDVGKARAADKRRDRTMKKNKTRERWMSPIFPPESPSTSSADRLCEDSERKVKLPNDQLPFGTCTEIINSLKETLSIEVPNTDGARMATCKDHRGNSEGLSYARDMSRLKDHLKQVRDGTRNSSGDRGDREDLKNTQTEKHKEVVTSSTRYHSAHDSRDDSSVKPSQKADANLGKRARTDSFHKRSWNSCHYQPVNPEKTKKKDMNSSGREIARNTDSRSSAETSGKENVAHQKDDRGKSNRVDNSRHKRTEEMSQSERHIDVAPLKNLSRSRIHCKDSKQDRHGDSQKQESRRDHVPIKG
ncbi:hypothetical protein TELCIR_05548 [Teladorsagia circumcincta]|uniref:Uncharacterized protein n=1 Tax=Teladorsagia circumcincta TaxID=45464 RepID=A0A2G9UQI8_TELCI|nr:hypothetical protein TELCIR_05548 [Teladorsagia circumcincta]